MKVLFPVRILWEIWVFKSHKYLLILLGFGGTFATLEYQSLNRGYKTPPLLILHITLIDLLKSSRWRGSSLLGIVAFSVIYRSKIGLMVSSRSFFQKAFTFIKNECNPVDNRRLNLTVIVSEPLYINLHLTKNLALRLDN